MTKNILDLLACHKNNLGKMMICHLFVVSLQNKQNNKYYDIYRKSQQNIQSGYS